MHQTANEMRLEFDSRSCNESFARVTVAAFMTQLNPTLEEVADVKTAVSEAVTNVIIHAYPDAAGKSDTAQAAPAYVIPGRAYAAKGNRSGTGGTAVGKIWITCRIRDSVLTVEVRDNGCGIPDVKRAMEPLYTTRVECDRAGMGFAFMEAFMDTLEVESEVGHGTLVRMSKRIVREESAFSGMGAEETKGKLDSAHGGLADGASTEASAVTGVNMALAGR